jgi:hypothetical protein
MRAKMLVEIHHHVITYHLTKIGWPVNRNDASAHCATLHTSFSDDLVTLL